MAFTLLLRLFTDALINHGHSRKIPLAIQKWLIVVVIVTIGEPCKLTIQCETEGYLLSGFHTTSPTPDCLAVSTSLFLIIIIFIQNGDIYTPLRSNAT